ncbi:MAG: hypothetical protein D6775_15100 [Caldilineae bacterium]|nr:MAG: hypothetical protein D6775_15100 [Caldilineae bacterium]
MESETGRRPPWHCLFRWSVLLAWALFLAMPVAVVADGPPNPLVQPPPISPYGMDVLGPGWQWTFPREEATPRLDGPLRIDQADDVLKQAWAAGVRSGRVAAWWCFLEPERDQYVWQDLDIMIQLSSNYGIEPVPEILYTPYWARADAVPTTSCINNWRKNYAPDDIADWSEFIALIVRRYGSQGKNQVHYWEIWNEPDLPEFLSMKDDPGNGTVEVYARLLKAASEQIRANDPQAKVLLGGLSDIRGHHFLGDLLDLRGPLDVRDAFDIIPFHAFSDHHLKITKLTTPLQERGLSYELWVNELNNSLWHNDYDMAAREIGALFDTMWQVGVTRTFWFKSYTTKWGPGIFYNRDPLWEIRPWLPSPFYSTYRQQAFPHELPGVPLVQAPEPNLVSVPRPEFRWARPTAGTYAIAGYKLQVDDSLYRGVPYFHAPEIDVYVPAQIFLFLPLQVGGQSRRGVADPASTHTSAGPQSWPSLEQLTYTPEQELDPGRYYWRVAAVDTQGNVGPYSEPRRLIIVSGRERTYLPWLVRP